MTELTRDTYAFDPENVTIGTANLHYGGINPRTRDDTSLRVTMDALSLLNLDILAVQEVDGGGNPHDIWRTYRLLGNRLGMEPVLGPSCALKTTTGNHVGILVRTHPRGLQIDNQWPAPGAAETRVPWCSAEIRVPGLDAPLVVYSGHLSARSETEQLRAVEIVTNIIAENDQFAIWLADFNGYPSEPEISSEALAHIPKHLQITRCVEDVDGKLHPNLDVYHKLIRAGMLDVAECLPPSKRHPKELQATGRGLARIDRAHAVGDLVKAATSYRQVETGSDHDACIFTFNFAQLF